MIPKDGNRKDTKNMGKAKEINRWEKQKMPKDGKMKATQKMGN